MRIIFIGTSEFAVPILKSIKSQTDWEVVLVVSESAKPAGRKNLLIDSPIAQTARELKLNLITPKFIKDSATDIATLKPDVIVVVAYGQILPKEIMDLAKYKTVNVHPSLLPKLRGASPIQEVLKAGLKETGVSLMVIDEKVDHGPIISQEVLAIDDNDTYLTLEPKLADLGSKMVVHNLFEYVSGKIKPMPQDDSQATFTKLIKKENGQINWQKMSAQEIYNLWRAYIKWPGVYTFFKNKSGQSIRLKLIELECSTLSVEQKQPGEVFTDESKSLYIACQAGAIKIKKLQPEGARVLTSTEFLNGYLDIINQILN